MAGTSTTRDQVAGTDTIIYDTPKPLSQLSYEEALKYYKNEPLLHTINERLIYIDKNAALKINRLDIVLTSIDTLQQKILLLKTKMQAQENESNFNWRTYQFIFDGIIFLLGTFLCIGNIRKWHNEDKLSET
ncbi:MAG TPA: hypothetical protein PL045_01030 [Chitinophagaceae bacterium]|nr:hypothetical protein [Chitinophagaceae bacterium]